MLLELQAVLPMALACASSRYQTLKAHLLTLLTQTLFANLQAQMEEMLYP